MHHDDGFFGKWEGKKNSGIECTKKASWAMCRSGPLVGTRRKGLSSYDMKHLIASGRKEKNIVRSG